MQRGGMLAFIHLSYNLSKDDLIPHQYTIMEAMSESLQHCGDRMWPVAVQKAVLLVRAIEGN